MEFGRAVLLMITIGIAFSAIQLRKMDEVVVPHVHDPDELPELVPNTLLKDAKQLWRTQIKGPEAFAVGPDGLLYMGLADGRIVRLDPLEPRKSARSIVFTGDPNLALPLPCGLYDTEPLCGRPLGMEFDANGRLIVADAYKGLLSVDVHTGAIDTLSIKGGKRKLKFTNDVAISSSGLIYFTDSSRRSRRDHAYDFLEQSNHGRLLVYNPAKGRTKVLLTGLYFANGILLSKDETYLLIAETTRYRIRKYFIKGPQKGESVILADNLPGFPDNLNWMDDTKTSFLVGCGSKRTAVTQTLSQYPKVRALLGKIVSPEFLYKFVPAYGLLLHIDATDGHIINTAQDPSGKGTKFISGGMPIDKYIFMGSPQPWFNYLLRVENPWLSTKE